MIRAVIFDVGGVLIQIPNRKYYRYLHEKSGLSTDKVEHIIRSTAPMVESGRVSVKTFTKRISAKFGIKSSELDWLQPLRDGARIDIDVLEVARLLNRYYVVGYLTNVDRARYIYAKRIIGDDYFRYKFVSCYMGCVKPGKRIYREVLRKMKLKPEELVFIDNEPENIKSAAKLGIHAVLFTTRRQLDIDLSKLRLNV